MNDVVYLQIRYIQRWIFIAPTIYKYSFYTIIIIKQCPRHAKGGRSPGAFSGDYCF